MQTPPVEMDRDLQEKVHRIEVNLAQLNARIARLAMVLKAPLESEEEMQRILSNDAEFLHAPEPGGSSGGDHRVRSEWQELRGLLVLRCDLMSHTLNELGLQLTQQITCNVEEQLEREGFKPGADAFFLHRRLNEPG